MFSGIKEVDWDKLTGAHGSAGAVPKYFEMMMSSQPAIWVQALLDLTDTIAQGCIYSSTPLAVPFLIEIVSSTEHPCRAGVLETLADIADATRFWSDADSAQRPIGAGEREEWARTLDETRARLKGIVELSIYLLGDKEPAVRIGAGYLIGALAQLGISKGKLGELQDVLAGRAYGESNLRVRAGAFVALSRVAARWPPGVATLYEALTRENAYITRIAIAYSIMSVDPSPAAEVVAVLTAAMNRPGELDEAFAPLASTIEWEYSAVGVGYQRIGLTGLPVRSDNDLHAPFLWFRRRPIFYLVEVLCKLDRARASELTPTAVSLINDDDGSNSYAKLITGPLIRCFAGTARDGGAITDMDAATILRAVGDNPRLWARTNLSHRSILRELNLPLTRDELFGWVRQKCRE